jgi:hypothetical protein
MLARQHRQHRIPIRDSQVATRNPRPANSTRWAAGQACPGPHTHTTAVMGSISCQVHVGKRMTASHPHPYPRAGAGGDPKPPPANSNRWAVGQACPGPHTHTTAATDNANGINTMSGACGQAHDRIPSPSVPSRARPDRRPAPVTNSRDIDANSVRRVNQAASTKHAPHVHPTVYHVQYADFECRTLPYHLSRRAEHLTMHVLREARPVPGPPSWKATLSQSGIPRGADCHDEESDDTRAHNTL